MGKNWFKQNLNSEFLFLLTASVLELKHFKIENCTLLSYILI